MDFFHTLLNKLPCITAQTFHGFLEEKAGGYMVNRLYSGERVDIPVSILYYPDINRYGGRESIQIVMPTLPDIITSPHSPTAFL